MFLNEKISTEITGKYDVIVCGGGFGGISAALASARMGKKTLLLERQYMLGGLGTAGLVTVYLPICDGVGHQVCFGMAEELFRLSISLGAEERYPANWLDGEGTRTEKDQRFMVRYNPQLFAILVEKLLVSEGVDVLYGSYAVGVKKKKNKISHITVENKSGRHAYAVKSVVDATGDADIAKFAKAPTAVFEAWNAIAAWYYYVGKDGYDLKELGYHSMTEEEKREFASNNKIFPELDEKEISRQMYISHQRTLNDFMKKREADPGIWPVTISTIPQIRMTRRIVGDYELKSSEVHTYFEDSVGMIPSWRERGPVYEVPFSSLYSSKVKNLITAGRCTSADDKTWDLIRAIPGCAVTGQAAGTAATMTDDFTSLDVKKLQEQLVKDGVVLHEKDLAK